MPAAPSPSHGWNDAPLLPASGERAAFSHQSTPAVARPAPPTMKLTVATSAAVLARESVSASPPVQTPSGHTPSRSFAALYAISQATVPVATPAAPTPSAT